MRRWLMAVAAALALAGCSTAASVEPDALPLVEDTPAAVTELEQHDHEDDAADVTPTLEDLSAGSDIEPEVLAAMIVIVAGGDVDGAIDAGEFDEVALLEALDLLDGIDG